MAYTGTIKKEDFNKVVEKIKNSDKDHYLSLVPSEQLEHFILKAVHLENETIVPAIHTRSQDIYIITKGKALMTYKGELVEPYKDDVEKDHETIRGKDIKNGETFEIKEGDIICIPPNVPHAVDATNSKITFITVKIDDIIK